MTRTQPRAAQKIVNTFGQQAWMELVRRYGRTFRHGSAIVTCDADVVRALLMERPHVERRPAAHRLMGAMPGVGGVLFHDGEPWRLRARALAPVFHRHNVDAFANSLHLAAIARASQWQAQPPADLYDAVQQFGAAAILEAGYGIAPGDPLGITLAQALVRYKNNSMTSEPGWRFDKFHPGVRTLLAMPRILWRMRRDQAAVRHAVDAVLAAGAYGRERPNWIGRLLEAGLSGAELASELNHLYGAFNAVDFVTTAALYELARHPEIARAMRAELLATVGEAAPTRDDLQRLPVTNGFLLEILRRYPVSMAIVRQTGAEMTLAGERVAAGSQVMILLHALHHHPDYWDDPDTIKPERWLASSAPNVPYSYVPFLLGARKCQGRDLAEQHFLLTVAAVIRRFDVRVFADAVIPPFMVPRFGAAIPFALETPA